MRLGARLHSKRQPVPRYHFHISDGSLEFTDSDGREFGGLRAARAHAAVALREAKAALCEKEVRDLSGWSMRVTDARGRTVFTLGFDLRERETATLAPQRGKDGDDAVLGAFDTAAE